MKSKKALVASLAMAFTLSLAGTAFAASGNPFTDVPSKHWAYDAVSKLAKAGIVDGYNDSTFRGDKTMTRYEMAQIVAKAMAKSDKADAQTKAMIDKLQTEFADELKGLNVRLTVLEKKSDNIKFSGSVRERYEWIKSPANAQDNPYYETRLRLAMTAPVGDGLTFKGRIQSKDEMGYTWYGYDKNAKNSNKPWDKSTGSTIMVDQAYLSGKVDNSVDVAFGRFPLTIGYGMAFDTGSNNDGIKIGFGNALKVNVGAMKNWGYDYQFGDISYNVNKDLGFKVGYLQDQDFKSEYKTTTAGLSFNAAKDINITAEFGVNKADKAKWQGDDSKAETYRIQYLSQDSSQKGSYDVWAGYRKADPNFDDFYWATVDAPFQISGLDNIKGWEAGVDYTIFKNGTLSLNYADMKSNDNKDTNKKYFIGSVSYSF